MKQTDDLRIKAIKELSTPAQIHQELPITEEAANTVYEARQAIHRILHDEDDRLLVIIGPCSVHDPVAALDYAQRLLQIAPGDNRLKSLVDALKRQLAPADQ